jgi:hypothetical protein
LLIVAPAYGGEKSRLEELSDAVGKLLNLTIEETRLALDGTSWEKENKENGEAPAPAAGLRLRVGVGQPSGIDRRFRELGKAAGGGGFSMTTSGRYRSQRFTGAGLDGELYVSADRIRITLRETDAPRNQLNVESETDGDLRIVHTNGRGDILVLAQQPDGPCAAAHITKDDAFTGRAESFPAFYRKHAAYVDGRLFPLLRRLGVHLFPGRLSPEVIRAVCVRLRPLTDAERAAFARLLAQLDHDDFRTREAATKALAKKYPRYAAQVQAALENPASAEVAARLKDVVAAHQEHHRIETLTDAMGLADDPVYLAAALVKAQGTDVETLLRRLRELSGKDLGKNPAAWKAWAAEQRP